MFIVDETNEDSRGYNGDDVDIVDIDRIRRGASRLFDNGTSGNDTEDHPSVDTPIDKAIGQNESDDVDG